MRHLELLASLSFLSMAAYPPHGKWRPLCYIGQTLDGSKRKGEATLTGQYPRRQKIVAFRPPFPGEMDIYCE
jgi:hypothetical protein